MILQQTIVVLMMCASINKASALFWLPPILCLGISLCMFGFPFGSVVFTSPKQAWEQLLGKMLDKTGTSDRLLL